MIFSLLDSAALALTLCWLITWNPKFWTTQSSAGQLLSGMAFGIAAIMGMLNPVQLTGGVIYDARLIIINAATLFGGPIVGITAASMASIYRYWVGGIGAPSGIISLYLAFSVGLLFRHAISRDWIRPAIWSFFAMGLATHGILLGIIQFTLDTTKFQTPEFLISELVTLPLMTILLCYLMQNQKQRLRDRLDAQKSFAHLKAISEAMPDLLMVIDEDGKYIEIFSANQELLVAPREKLIGHTMHEVFPKQEADFFLSWIKTVINSQNTKSIEYTMDTGGGKREFEARAKKLDKNGDGKNAVVVLTRDVTARKLLEREVHRLAYFDPLTHLPNRRQLMEHLEALEESQTDRKTVSALFHIDLDDFKFINEVHGHVTGNEILIALVHRLQESINSECFLARIGGDSFAILVRNIPHQDHEAKKFANEFANRILIKAREPFLIQNNQITLSASMGIVMLSGSYPLSELMVWAELALYTAKEEGKNTACFYDPALQESAAQKFKLENEIRVALITNQFKLFYQPQYNDKGNMIGVEALLRWNHPEKGLLSPINFLPVAEQAGLISDIDRWVFERACKDHRQLVAGSNNPHLSTSINIGGALLSQADLFVQLSEIASKVGVNPENIQIEVTETTLVKNLERSKAEMLKLKNIGFKFSLDDFGTGYSSFNYLHQFPIDEVKIDRSFINGLPDDPEGLAIIKAVVSLSETFGFNVIAEGVKNIEQEQTLIRNGCKNFQGYFYSRPQPLDELLEMIHRRLI